MASTIRGFARAGAAALIAVASLSPAFAAGPQPVPRNQAPPLHADPGPCAQYGAGFVKVAGSDTCIKAGASVQSDAYIQNNSTESSSQGYGRAISPALRSQ